MADNNDETEVEFLKSSRKVSRCKEFQISKDSKQEFSPTKFSDACLQYCSAGPPPLDGGSSLKRQRKK